MLDSGSFYSLISQNLANRLRIKSNPLRPETEQSLFSATGCKIKIKRNGFELDISNLKIAHTVYICQNLSEDLLLGPSFLGDASAIIDFKNQTVSFSEVIQVPLHKKINKKKYSSIHGISFRASKFRNRFKGFLSQNV